MAKVELLAGDSRVLDIGMTFHVEVKSPYQLSWYQADG